MPAVPHSGRVNSVCCTSSRRAPVHSSKAIGSAPGGHNQPSPLRTASSHRHCCLRAGFGPPLASVEALDISPIFALACRTAIMPNPDRVAVPWIVAALGDKLCFPVLAVVSMLAIQATVPESQRLGAPTLTWVGAYCTTMLLFHAAPVMYSHCRRLWIEANSTAKNVGGDALSVSSLLVLSDEGLDRQFREFLAKIDTWREWRDVGYIVLSATITFKASSFPVEDVRCSSYGNPCRAIFFLVIIAKVYSTDIHTWKPRVMRLWLSSAFRLTLILFGTLPYASVIEECFNSLNPSLPVPQMLIKSVALSTMQHAFNLLGIRYLCYFMPCTVLYAVTKMHLSIAWRESVGASGWASLSMDPWWGLWALAGLPSSGACMLFYSVRYTLEQRALVAFLNSHVGTNHSR